MTGRTALLVVLLIVATCAWASPINRDDLKAAPVAAQVPKGPVSSQAPSAAKNETSSNDAPKPAQSSTITAEKQEAESPVTEAANSTKLETVTPALVQAADKVVVAAEFEEAAVTEKVEAEKVAVPAGVVKTKEVSPVTKKEEAEKVSVSAGVERTKEESLVTKKEEAEKVAVAAKREETKEEFPVTEKVEVGKVEVPAEKESTVVEKADGIKQSEIILSEEEVTTTAPIDEAKTVEKASPSSPEEPEIAEEVTTVSPVADEEIIEERFRSAQVESDVSETTEKSKVEGGSTKPKEKKTKPVQNSAAVVEKSNDKADTQGDEEQSSATEAIPAAAADKIKVDKIPADDVATAVEKKIVATEASIEVTTIIDEEDHESIEATTPFDDASDREDTTEEPFDRIAEESSDVEIVTAISVESEDGSFRQGDIDITEAPEEEDISSTTAIPQSEHDINAEIRGEDETTAEPNTESPIDRMDSATDIIYVDVVTDQPEETTEKLIQADKLLKIKVEAEEDAATEAPEAEKEESGSIDVRDEGAQAITTEATIEKNTEIASSQTFDDAAPIKVVEIKESIKPVESIVPVDSAQIEIVEITEKSQALAKDKAKEKVQSVNEKESTESEPEIFQTTEVITDEKEEATTISSKSPEIRDEQEVPSSSGSEQDQEPEEGEEKPNASKIQPAPAGDYWLSMQAEGNKSAQAPAKPAKPSTTAEEVPAENIEEAKDVDVNIRVGNSTAPAAVVAPAKPAKPSTTAEEVPAENIEKAKDVEVNTRVGNSSAPAAVVAQNTSIDDEIAKVAQKYGLQSVGKVSPEVKPVQEVASDAQAVSDADVPKEDSIYLGSERKKSDFQESNDLQRRLSFGDKVVRFARSFL